MNIWYSTHVEKPIREIVYALRNHGINTICSCGHDGIIMFDAFPKDTEEWIHIAMNSIGISPEHYRIEIDKNNGTMFISQDVRNNDFERIENLGKILTVPPP